MQVDPDVFDGMLIYEPFIVIFILIFMIVLNLYLTFKIRIWFISFFIFIFSIFVWIGALGVNLPMAPVFQNFFIIFQGLLFISITYRASKG